MERITILSISTQIQCERVPLTRTVSRNTHSTRWNVCHVILPIAYSVVICHGIIYYLRRFAHNSLYILSIYYEAMHFEMEFLFSVGLIFVDNFIDLIGIFGCVNGTIGREMMYLKMTRMTNRTCECVFRTQQSTTRELSSHSIDYFIEHIRMNVNSHCWNESIRYTAQTNNRNHFSDN